jgi:hypothetical protein
MYSGIHILYYGERDVKKNIFHHKISELYDELNKLSRILEFINSCDKSLKNICCGYCLKYYKFNRIKLHKCKYK